MSFQEYSESLSSRLHMGKVKGPILIGMIVLCGLLICCIAWGFLSMANKNSFEIVKAEAKEEAQANYAQNEQEEVISPEQICVYVSGCVIDERLCELDEGSRVADAIEFCGGFTEDADRSAVNLARRLVDGEQIVIPNISTAEPDSNGGLSGYITPSNNNINPGANQQTEKVNINLADSAALQTLSGIGESKAAKIIAYREANGPFKSIDDLSCVSGIGEKTLDALRDFICV